MSSRPSRVAPRELVWDIQPRVTLELHVTAGGIAGNLAASRLPAAVRNALRAGQSTSE